MNVDLMNSADRTGISRYRSVISGRQPDSESDGQEMKKRRGAFAAATVAESAGFGFR
jgi:hypothetical protein